MNFPASLLLVLAFLGERAFFVFKPNAGSKAFAWHPLELVVLLFAVGGIAWLLEGKLGDVHRQNWELHAVNAALFVVFAYPGFVYRHLWRRRGA